MKTFVVYEYSAALITLPEKLRTEKRTHTCDCGHPLSTRSTEAMVAAADDHARWTERRLSEPA